jgi:hypothetical protein
MLQNHHALSKYDKAKTWSAMRMHSIKGTVLLRQTMNSDTYAPFNLAHCFKNNSS